ncbi:MAG: sigma-70 family RNA polymerase sigma factor [Actinomycetota bacterium]|nr:sigma-70 family RNA polymerase sigma factor [Actinomycetota bacterium]
MIDEGSDVLGDEADARVLAGPARALHFDPHDFAGLYIRHRTAFTLLARRYLRDARDADDVVQEAFLRLFLALPELETELQALAYCRRTITNLCIDRYRAQARRPSLVDIGTIPLEELPDEDHGDPVVRAEDAALVREALSMLSPLHRAALVKREIEEKSLPVIAEELEVPEESVKHLLFRARRALRRLLVGTSLEPGSDGEGGLGLLTRAGPGGVAAFLLLMVLGLGSGPNLRAIPVVGVDLPEIIPVTDIATSVGHAVTDVVDAVAPSHGVPSGAADSGSEPAPQVAGDPSPSPTTAPATTSAPSAPPAQPRPATAASTASPAAPVTRAPAPEPMVPDEHSASPSVSPSVSPSASPAPTATPTEPEPSTGPKPSEPPSSASPSPSATDPAPSPSGSPGASALPSRGNVPKSGRLLEVSQAP